MGKLVYASRCEIDIDDRTLAHLKVVILSKLRLDQSFAFNWQHEGEGRSTVWIHPAVPLEFTFDSSTRPSPNRRWIDALLYSANSSEGLRIVPEPEDAGIEEDSSPAVRV